MYVLQCPSFTRRNKNMSTAAHNPHVGTRTMKLKRTRQLTWSSLLAETVCRFISPLGHFRSKLRTSGRNQMQRQDDTNILAGGRPNQECCIFNKQNGRHPSQVALNINKIKTKSIIHSLFSLLTCKQYVHKSMMLRGYIII